MTCRKSPSRATFPLKEGKEKEAGPLFVQYCIPHPAPRFLANTLLLSLIFPSCTILLDSSRFLPGTSPVGGHQCILLLEGAVGYDISFADDDAEGDRSQKSVSRPTQEMRGPTLAARKPEADISPPDFGAMNEQLSRDEVDASHRLLQSWPVCSVTLERAETLIHP
jgi:hypothetical protein